MRQIHLRKRPRPSADQLLEPLPLDPRDPDVVRAKQLTRVSARRPVSADGQGGDRAS